MRLGSMPRLPSSRRCSPKLEFRSNILCFAKMRDQYRNTVRSESRSQAQVETVHALATATTDGLSESWILPWRFRSTPRRCSPCTSPQAPLHRVRERSIHRLRLRHESTPGPYARRRFGHVACRETQRPRIEWFSFGRRPCMEVLGREDESRGRDRQDDRRVDAASFRPCRDRRKTRPTSSSSCLTTLASRSSDVSVPTSPPRASIESPLADSASIGFM